MRYFAKSAFETPVFSPPSTPRGAEEAANPRARDVDANADVDARDALVVDARDANANATPDDADDDAGVAFARATARDRALETREATTARHGVRS